ncbi:hypothetical protein SBADM41S_00638 [Streptomyces badius]
MTALTCALALGSGLGGPRSALVTAAVLTGQLSVGWRNDAYDARRDARACRRGKPASDGTVGAGAVWAAAVVALAVCVLLSLACGVLAGTVHLAAVAAAWLYNLRLKATALSWLPYVAGFEALPAAVALSLPGGPAPRWWTVAAGALLGFAAHLADTLPDITVDRAAGIRGLPHRLGDTGTRLLLPLPLLGATAVLALGPPGPVDAAGAAALVLAEAAAIAGFPDGGRIRRSIRIDGDRRRETPDGTSPPFLISFSAHDRIAEFPDRVTPLMASTFFAQKGTMRPPLRRPDSRT